MLGLQAQLRRKSMIADNCGFLLAAVIEKASPGQGFRTMKETTK